MTRGQLLKMLERQVSEFRRTATDSIAQNAHLTQIDNEPTLSQKQIDAVLVGFINHIGADFGIDLGLRASDLK